MLGKMIVAGLAWCAVVAHAVPIGFVNTQFETMAMASAQGATDVRSASSPPSALPLISEALAAGSTDVATAGALGAAGFVSTAADITAITGFTSAIATSFFTGSLIADGLIRIDIALDILDLASGRGSGLATLFVTLTSNGVTLIDEVLTSAISTSFFANVGSGSANVFELMLVSEAQGVGAADGGPSGAFNLALVQFSAEVPLLPTHAFILLGLALMAAMRRPVVTRG